ncbi:MAG: hypothetical protein JWR85_2422 [Marmoricola sp.]|nr:hypothetical protein [Marmoricola sp.]
MFVADSGVVTTQQAGVSHTLREHRRSVRLPVLAGLPVPVLGLAVLSVALRLPYLGAPLTPDEGGFLMVAQQWRPGDSLYGSYWVDRPPLLLEIFKIADTLGGLAALRLLGCLAAGVTVLGVGMAVRRAVGPEAAAWSAAVACALLVSPLAGAIAVNGELLAAPFIAIGVWMAVVAVSERHGRSGWAAAAAGACAIAAVLVKQNMLDVLVFAGVLGLVCWRAGSLRGADARRAAVWFVGGGLATLVAVLGLAWLRGTSPGGVLFAMYPFRLRAVAVVEHVSLAQREARLHELRDAELLTAGPLLLLALVVVVILARRRSGVRPWPGLRSVGSAVAVAAVALTAYDVSSVVIGGNYWLHYLVQLVVPTALAAGLLVGAVPRSGRTLVAVVLVAATMAWTFGLDQKDRAPGPAVGTAIGRTAEPGDTLVSAFGAADIAYTAGLDSPYPYLWSLPARTLDPRFSRLRSLLAGPRAPTWFVARNNATMGVLERRGVGTVLGRRYHLVGEVCGRDIYLLNGVRRPAPVATVACTQPLSTWVEAAPR